MIRIITICLLFVASVSNIDAQNVKRYYLSLGHGYGIPLADMGERFGNHFESTIGLEQHNHKTNIIWGIDASLIYGKRVKEDVLAPLIVDGNPLIGADGSPSQVVYRERGNSGYLTVSKLFSPKESKSQSGVKVGIGLGIMQHHIRIQNDSRNNVFLQGNYKKGYDRWSFGPALKQMVGYRFLNTKFNYSAALQLEVEEGFTKNIRDVNLDTGLKDDKTRLDILVNLKAIFYLKIASKGDADDIFY